MNFDYVVAGGGTAGSVLAARLSEDPAVRVLLLEAGAGVPLPSMANPLAWPTLAGSSVDWGDDTVPQRGLDGSVAPYPRGKVLGGSSGINGMMHIRGDRSAYDAWEAGGATGWNYDALLPYFRRSERTDHRDPKYRGTSGPMHVGVPATTDPLWEMCFAAAVEAGHPAVDDSNAAQAEGTSWNDMTVVNGRRQTAADAYLTHRPNLTVVADAEVRSLVMDGTTCRGVGYVVGSTATTVHADREVILAAGAIGSPAVMLRSGIGPADELRALGIDVHVDLAGVGANLQDHPKSQVAYSATRPVRGGFARKPHVLLRSAGAPTPDLQLIFVEFAVKPRWAPQLDDDGFSVIFSLMSPASRGTVRLAPNGRTLIDPAFLTDPDDVRRMLAGLEAAREVGAAAALAPVRGQELFPDAATEYLRATVTTYFHPVGTCKLGTDATAVVDPDLRVYGVHNLRIADASIMPSIPSGNTNAPTLAIAERAADLIKRS